MNYKYRLPIKKLFEIFNLDKIEYDTPVKITHDIKIQSIDTFVKVNYFIKKQHRTAKYIFENNNELSCSIDHLVFEKNVVKTIKSCSTVNTINDELKIISVTDLGIQNVYDVSLDSPHQYTTPNGIIHHNTTIAKVLLNELNINEFDILELNASRTNSVEDVRNKIVNFVQMIPFGNFKVVLLDEADFLSIQSQAALRGLLEEYHSTARFIFTANYKHKIIPALHSRCQGSHIESLDLVEFTARVAEILITEKIDFDLDVLDSYVKAAYPDLRKCINNLQMNCIDLKLILPNAEDNDSTDYRVSMVDLFKAGRVSDARKLVCSKIQIDEIEELYRWLYSNLDYFGTTERQQDNAILILKQAMVDHTLCIDPEINLAACLVRLARNIETT